MRRVDHRHAPPVRHTAICLPGDPYKTVVDETGALRDLPEPDTMSLATYRYRRSVGFRLRQAFAPVGTRQWIEDARVPFVVTEHEGDGLILRLEAFGHADRDGRRTDVVRWSITATTAGGADAALLVVHDEPGVRAEPAGEAPGCRCFAVADEPSSPALDLDTHFRLPAEPTEPDADPVLISHPWPLTLVSAVPSATTPVLATPWRRLERGASMQGAVLVPRGHGGPSPVVDAEQMADDARRFWRGASLGVDRMSVPDDGIDTLLVASARTLQQMREDRDGRRRFQVGPSVYRGLWIVDGYFLLEAARYLGDDEAGRDGLDALLEHAGDDGSIQILPGHLKETGVALACVMRQAELEGRPELAPERWDLVERGLDHIAALRETARQLPADDPAHGLFPPAMADGGLGGVRAEYTSTLWTLAGLHAVAQTAGALGRSDVAARAAALRDGLRAAFDAHATRDAVTLSTGQPFLPMAKPGSGNHNRIPDFPVDAPVDRRIRPATATWTLAQAVHPGEVLAPDHPLVAGLCEVLDEIDDDQGIPEGTGWLPHEAVWTYAASFYAHVWLCAGRPDKAVDYLYAFGNHATPTGVWREEQSLDRSRRGEYLGDMPHGWASAEFIRLVRHLLVLERDRTLHLAPGLPSAWLDGDGVRVDRTPTRFGRVSLAARRGDAIDLTVTREPGLFSPREVVLHVGAFAPGPARITVDGSVVEAPIDGRLFLPHQDSVAVRIEEGTAG